MLPSTGYFKGINCPFYESGLCERPYCHFRHTKKEVTESNSDSLDKDEILQKLVSEAVKKVLQHTDSKSSDAATDANPQSTISKVVQGLIPVTTNSIVSSSTKVTYNPTPISELKKLMTNNTESQPVPSGKEYANHKHIPVPYTPHRPSRSHIDRASNKLNITTPLPNSEQIVGYSPQPIEQEKYTPVAMECESSVKYLPGSLIEHQPTPYSPISKSNNPDKQFSNAKSVSYTPTDIANISNINNVSQYTPVGVGQAVCVSGVSYSPGATVSAGYSTSSYCPTNTAYSASSIGNKSPCYTSSISYQPTPLSQTAGPKFSSDEDEEPEIKRMRPNRLSVSSSNLNALEDMDVEFEMLGQILEDENDKSNKNDNTVSSNIDNSVKELSTAKSSVKESKSHSKSSSKHKSDGAKTNIKNDKHSKDPKLLKPDKKLEKSSKSESEKRVSKDKSSDKHSSSRKESSTKDIGRKSLDKSSCSKISSSKSDRSVSKSKSYESSNSNKASDSKSSHKAGGDLKKSSKKDESKELKSSSKQKDLKVSSKSDEHKHSINKHEDHKSSRKSNDLKDSQRSSESKSSSKSVNTRDDRDHRTKKSSDSSSKSNKSNSLDKKSDVKDKKRDISSSDQKLKSNKSSKEKHLKRERSSSKHEKHSSKTKGKIKDDTIIVLSDNSLSDGEMIEEFSDLDEEQINQECLRIFEEYVPVSTKDLNNHQQEVRKQDPSDLDNLTSKKRIAHSTNQTIYRTPMTLLPDHKSKAVQLVNERSAKVKEFHESRIKRISNEQSQSLFDEPSVSSASSSSKVRIAHVPNVSTLLNAKKALKIPEPPKNTVVQTVSKGSSRVAHVPNDKFCDRPGVLEPLASKIPANIRTRYLHMIIDECLKIYLAPEDAYERAQQEELQTTKRCTAVPIYKNSAILAVTRLRKEVQESGGVKVGKSDVGQSGISHNKVLLGKLATHDNWSVGNKYNKKDTEFAAELKGSKFYKNVSKWILSEEELQSNGFPRSHPDRKERGLAKIHTQNTKQKPQKGFIRICCRCKREYTVNKKGMATTQEECIYHPNNKYRFRGEVKYQCCGQDGSSDGCLSASCHVYEYVDHDNLRGFVKTISKDSDNSDYGVYALDCEMCYTTNGLDLTRVTVIDNTLNVIYESLVKPIYPIIDYNTRYSGLTEESMKDVTTTLLEVQATLLHMFSDKTILVGHSLESDFKALKFIHSTVIDTSVLFPHKMGPPYKRALRNLTSEYLKKIIQNSLDGHDSAEDATVCMELLIWKLKEDLKTR